MAQVSSLEAVPADFGAAPLSLDRIRSTKGAAGQAREIARHFEALLIQEVIRAARSAGGSGWLGEDADQASEAAAQMGEEFLANALAAGGGIGLAKVMAPSIENQLARRESQERTLEKNAEKS
jgi:Rod binding domain-containing protein